MIRLERELAYGATGDDVEALQTRLIRLGLLAALVLPDPPDPSVPPDSSVAPADPIVEPSGTFDVPTFLAVQAFQLTSNLPATGVADIATLDALGFDTAGIPVVAP